MLDTPGVLPPKILDTEIYSKLALTGMILPAKFCSSMGLDVSYSLSKCVRVTLVCKWSNSHVYIIVISKDAWDDIETSNHFKNLNFEVRFACTILQDQLEIA